MTTDQQLVEALKGCLDIMRHYHVCPHIPANADALDRCENPGNCGHCRAVKVARAALKRGEDVITVTR